MRIVGEAHKAENTVGQASLGSHGVTEQTQCEHRSIYYRLYTKQGPLESSKPIFSNDSFISRISSRSVRPPHTAASLKRCVCKIEELELDSDKSTLYLSLSETDPPDDSARLVLRGNSDGPGSSEVDPVVFVIDKDAAEKRPKPANKAGSVELPIWKAEQKYVYYRLYDDDSEAISKTSFDADDSSLGRIDTFFVPPPHTIASLKNCLVHVEGVSSHDVQLLENEDGEVTLNDDDPIALLTDNYLGSKKGQPIVFTYARQNASAITTVPEESVTSFSRVFTPPKSPIHGPEIIVAIHSVFFPNHYLSLDATGVTQYTDFGGGEIKTPTSISPHETFFLQQNDADGTVCFKSTAFNDVYIRMDGGNVPRDTALPAGGGFVNGQYTANLWEKFYIRKKEKDNGKATVVGIESAAFPGRYLRLDAHDGVVNVQGVFESLEEFEILIVE